MTERDRIALGQLLFVLGHIARAWSVPLVALGWVIGTACRAFMIGLEVGLEREGVELGRQLKRPRSTAQKQRKRDLEAFDSNDGWDDEDELDDEDEFDDGPAPPPRSGTRPI